MQCVAKAAQARRLLSVRQSAVNTENLLHVSILMPSATEFASPKRRQNNFADEREAKKRRYTAATSVGFSAANMRMYLRDASTSHRFPAKTM